MAWVERQLPQVEEIFLDHIGYFVPDLNDGAAALRRLGFQFTDINIQYNADADGNMIEAGTANRLVLLEIGYIEMLGAVSDTPLADQLEAGLARYPGFHVVAMSHADMDARYAHLEAEGFQPQPAVRLRRRIDTQAGVKQVAFSVLRTKPGAMAEGRVQMLTHHTPALVWTPGSTVHDNRAEALTGLLICVADPAEAAARYARFTGKPVSTVGGLATVTLDRGAVTFAGAEEAEDVLPDLDLPNLPYIAGVSLRSANIPATRQALADRAVRPLHSDNQLICLGPRDALGGYLLFHAAGVASPWQALAAPVWD